MASLAILFSTAAAIIVSLCLAMFGDPSFGELVLAYFTIGQLTFWAIILRLSGLSETAAPLRN